MLLMNHGKAKGGLNVLAWKGLFQVSLNELLVADFKLAHTEGKLDLQPKNKGTFGPSTK